MGLGLAGRQLYRCGEWINSQTPAVCGRGLRTGRRRSGFLSRLGRAVFARIPHVPLTFDELTIVRRIEIKKSPTRGKVLDERLADGIAGSSGKCGHHKSACDR